MSENNFKLLLVSYYFPPLRLSGSVRTLKFVKYLLRNNWKSTVITSDYIDDHNYDESLQKELDKLNIEVIRIKERRIFRFFRRVDPIRRPRKIVKRLLNYISNIFFVPDSKKRWAKEVKEKVIELLKREHFDVILVSCPPFSAFSELTKISSTLRIPIVVDYRNLWFGRYNLNYPTPLHRIKHKKLEYKALKTAEKVIVSNRKIKEKLIQFFPFLTFESVTIIETGFDYEDFSTIKPYPRIKNKLVLLHYGDFNNESSAKYFLKSFNQLKLERPDIASNIELHFVGDIGKENIRLIRILNLHEFVINHGKVDYKEAISKIKSADILWLQIDNLKNIDAVLPTKLYYYLASGKPIFAMIPDGASKLLLENYEAVFFCSPADLDEIKKTFYKIFELYKQNALPFANEQSVEKYRVDFTVETLLKILQSQIKIL